MEWNILRFPVARPLSMPLSFVIFKKMESRKEDWDPKEGGDDDDEWKREGGGDVNVGDTDA